MVTSNEPGYYEDGNFGIRIENLCITTEANTENNFSGKKYCKFETISLAPIQTKLIDVSMLSVSERLWINEYHEKVRSSLKPLMEELFPEAIMFLMMYTEPI